MKHWVELKLFDYAQRKWLRSDMRSTELPHCGKLVVKDNGEIYSLTIITKNIQLQNVVSDQSGLSIPERCVIILYNDH